MCPTAYNMLHGMWNRWSPSRLRWTAERQDHALQEAIMKVKMVPPKKAPSMRGVKRLYKDPANAEKLEASFGSAAKAVGLTADALDALLQRPVAEVQLEDVRDLLDTTYPQLIQGLQSAHTSTQAADREEQRKSGPTEPRR